METGYTLIYFSLFLSFFFVLGTSFGIYLGVGVCFFDLGVFFAIVEGYKCILLYFEQINKLIIIYIMSNISEFKQQTFALLREQAIQLKQQTADISLKSQQISFLKDTIQVLEQQNSNLNKQNIQLKNKLNIVMKEVKKYDQDVVQKIYKQNQQLIAKWDGYEGEIGRRNDIVNEMSEAMGKMQADCDRIKGEMEDKDVNIRRLQAQKNEMQRMVQSFKSQRDQYQIICQQSQNKITHLQAVTQQQKQKLQNQSKQTQFLIHKCQETVHSCEQRIKKIKQKYVKKQQYTALMNQLKAKNKEKDEQGREVKKLLDKIMGLKYQISKAKEEVVKVRYEEENRRAMLDCDMRTLKQSLTLYKKVAEFQSQHSQQFYTIFSQMSNLKQSNTHLQSTNTNLQSTAQILQTKCHKLQSLLQQKTQQTSALHSKFNNQIQCLQSSYQGKIMQLSIKIKQQEQAIHQLSIRQQEHKDIEQQYDALAVEHTEMKNALENTIGQYRKENESLLEEMKELVQLCNENINVKNLMNNVKYVLVELLAVVQYMHVILGRGRQARRKLFMPFVQYYFQVKENMERSKQGQVGRVQRRERRLRKFKKCVWVVIAIKRMAHSLQVNGKPGQSGLLRYCNKAINNKNKIADYPTFSDKILQQSIKQQPQAINRLICMSKKAYRWNNIHNYQKVSLLLPDNEKLLAYLPMPSMASNNKH